MSYMGGLFFVLLSISKLYSIQILGNEKVLSKLLKNIFNINNELLLLCIYNSNRGRHGHARMVVVVFTTTYAIRDYHH
jgi:hypothetical protein